MSAFTENLLLALLLGFLPQVSHPPVLALLPSKCYSYTPSADQPLDMTIGTCSVQMQSSGCSCITSRNTPNHVSVLGSPQHESVHKAVKSGGHVTIQRNQALAQTVQKCLQKLEKEQN